MSGFLFVALSGGGSYIFTRLMQNAHGYHSTMLTFSSLLFTAGIWIIVGFHSQWVRVENPEFDFNKGE